MKQKRVARWVQFFRMATLRDAAGQPLRVNLAEMLAYVQNLPFDAEADVSAYSSNGDGTLNACWPQAERVVFATLRRSALPRVEDGRGNLSDLNIAESSALFEPIHVRFFPNNVVGADFNFYGPRINRLQSYLHNKVPIEVRGCDFALAPLFVTAPEEQLSKLKTIRSVDLRIERSHLAELEEQAQAGPFAAIRAAAEFGNATYVELKLQCGRTRKDELSPGLKNWLVGQARSTSFGSARRAIVSGVSKDTDKNAVLDLLRDRLVSKKEMLTINERTRVVNGESAFLAIQDAYNELKPSIDKASTVEIVS